MSTIVGTRKVQGTHRITNDDGNQLAGGANDEHSSSLLLRIGKLRRVSKYQSRSEHAERYIQRHTSD